MGYLERSLASSPVWQMGARTLERQVVRRDPRLLDFLANAKNAPLGELEFDVLTWMMTRWYQAGRPADGRLVRRSGRSPTRCTGGGGACSTSCCARRWTGSSTSALI